MKPAMSGKNLNKVKKLIHRIHKKINWKHLKARLWKLKKLKLSYFCELFFFKMPFFLNAWKSFKCDYCRKKSSVPGLVFNGFKVKRAMSAKHLSKVEKLIHRNITGKQSKKKHMKARLCKPKKLNLSYFLWVIFSSKCLFFECMTYFQVRLEKNV